MSFSQRMRMIWIDAVVDRNLHLRRSDICDAFDISVPQASKDLRDFMARFPARLQYDRSAKHYRAADANSAFDRAAHLPVINAQSVIQNLAFRETCP